MYKLLLITYSCFALSKCYCQHDIFELKKGKKTIARFLKGSTFSFMKKSKEWRKGEIVRIKNDSFYIEPVVVKYNMFGNSTIHYNIEGYTLADVYAIPNKGILIDFKDDRFQISRTGGHVHWYWIKSGWIFRVGAAGYILLNIFNSTRNNDLSIANNKISIGIGALVFAGGVMLHKIYKPFIKINKRYHFKTL